MSWSKKQRQGDDYLSLVYQLRILLKNCKLTLRQKTLCQALSLPGGTASKSTQLSAQNLSKGSPLKTFFESWRKFSQQFSDIFLE